MRFQIDDIEYSAGKMPAIVQFHVARRLTPVVGFLAAALENLDAAKLHIEKNTAGEAVNVKYDGDLQSVTTPLAKALSCLPDADVEYIFNAFLEHCERRQNGNWARMRRDGVTMFEPSLPELLQICFHVFKANMANFTQCLPQLSGLLDKTTPGQGRA